MKTLASKAYITKLVKQYYRGGNVEVKMPDNRYDIGRALYRIWERDFDGKRLFAFAVHNRDEYDNFQIVTRIDVLDADVILKDGIELDKRGSENELVGFLIRLDQQATNMKATTSEMNDRTETLYHIISEKPKNYMELLEGLHQAMFAFTH